MSHSKERKEKICLNCKAELNGRFCHVCGQENIEPKESVWGLITHFFHDITHFDGKFFDTVKWLIRKPGFLSREYMIGRRASYLNPVRMYVFTSAFFFILFFSFFMKVDNLFKVSSSSYTYTSKDDSGFVTRVDTTTLKPGERWRYKAGKEDTTKVDTSWRNLNERIKDSINQRMKDIAKPDSLSADTTVEAEAVLSDDFQSIEAYDSAQKMLPENQRDNWIERAIMRKEIELRIKFKGNREERMKEMANRFAHYFPQLLFVSLPLIALVLKLLYIRRRKEYYFVTHGIFLIHVYVYTFLNLTLYLVISKLKDYLGWNWLSIFQFLLFLHSVWYVYKAMRIFYQQQRLKTLLKFIAFNFITFIILTILFALFLVLSIWNM